MSDSRSLPNPRLVALVVVTVTETWAVTLIAGFVTGQYEPLIYTTPLMGAVVGWATGIRIWRNGESRRGPVE